ncbi:5-dehydro-4-deoxy-D-glucuronate isomerase [Candidatus Latescibacterota bacterium]
MEKRYSPDQVRFELMDTTELRESFLIENLFAAGEVGMIYSDIDRVIIGSAVPTDKALTLEAGKELAAEYFAERREIGVINLGGDGAVSVDGTEYPMVKLDALYIGRGSKEITFTSAGAADPAKFYIISYPAHKEYPTSHAPISQAEPLTLGSTKESNKRTIYKYIHPEGIKSCQLVMGCTQLEEGSVWNTMPVHTHDRRTEVYVYFDMNADTIVFHFIGEPEETRHVVVKNGQAVISPSWSIHSGCGTGSYTFIWAMGGENQDFGDMDGVPVQNIK